MGVVDTGTAEASSCPRITRVCKFAPFNILSIPPADEAARGVEHSMVFHRLAPLSTTCLLDVTATKICPVVVAVQGLPPAETIQYVLIPLIISQKLSSYNRRLVAFRSHSRI